MDPISREHTKPQREAAERLEAKTGSLDNRLMLRQIITKALKIKRAETGELPARGDAEQLPAKTPPSAVQMLPQRLTFYEVVQLARQQAHAKKTRKSNDDLIDLSDNPELSSSSPAWASVQGDLAVLDSGNSVATSHIYLNPSFHGEIEIPELEPSMRTSNEQRAVVELDTASPA
ncbi:MAG: hypothetical protein Q9208_000488 [Pyrenodesmia sp. 3 TL-2023]